MRLSAAQTAQLGDVLQTCLPASLPACRPLFPSALPCPPMSCPCSADDVDAPMLRFLFVQAMQPYLRHMHAWAFTAHVSATCAGSLQGWASRGGYRAAFAARMHACLQCCQATLYGCPAPDRSFLLACRL
jgi:hypothetical protein